MKPGTTPAGDPGKFALPLVAGIIFSQMLPVTGLVPVLQEITGGRHPGISDFSKHLFMSVNMIGAFLFAPLAGLLSDRFRARKPLIVTALFVNGLTLLAMRLDLSYPVYLSLRFVEGCAHIASLSLLMTLGIDYARRLAYGKTMGLLGAALTMGIAVGAPIGGRLGQDDPLNLFLYGSVLLCMLGLVAALGLREGPHAPREKEGLAPLLLSLRQHRLLLVPYAFTFVDRLSVGFIISTVTLYLRTVLEATPLEIGIILAYFMVPFSLLTYPSGRLCRRFNKLGMMILGSAGYGLLLIVLPAVELDTVRWLMLGGGVAAALMFAPSLVLTGLLAGEDNKALAMGGFHTAGSLGFLLGPLAGGAAVTFFAYSPISPYTGAFLVIGGLELVCALVFLPFLKRLRS